MLLSIYIYKTEAFEAPIIFHVSTILKKKTFLKPGIIKMKKKKKHPKISAKKKSQKPKTLKISFCPKPKPDNKNTLPLQRKHSNTDSSNSLSSSSRSPISFFKQTISSMPLSTYMFSCLQSFSLLYLHSKLSSVVQTNILCKERPAHQHESISFVQNLYPLQVSFYLIIYVCNPI